MEKEISNLENNKDFKKEKEIMALSDEIETVRNLKNQEESKLRLTKVKGIV